MCSKTHTTLTLTAIGAVCAVASLRSEGYFSVFFFRYDQLWRVLETLSSMMAGGPETQ